MLKKETIIYNYFNYVTFVNKLILYYLNYEYRRFH